MNLRIRWLISLKARIVARISLLPCSGIGSGLWPLPRVLAWRASRRSGLTIQRTSSMVSSSTVNDTRASDSKRSGLTSGRLSAPPRGKTVAR